MDFRRIVITALLFVSSLFLVAQDEVLSLIQKMEQTKGIEKVDLLNEISKIYRKSDRIEAMKYARLAYTFASRTNYMAGKALAKKNEGICWFFIGGNDSAKICYTEALGIFTKIKDDTGISACLNNLGLIAQETGKYDEALKYYKRSIVIDQRIGDINGVATTKRNLVDIFIYKGNSKDALLLSNELLHFYKINSDKDGIMRTLINRAAIFDNLKLFDKAIFDLDEAIVLAKEINDSFAQAMAMSNLGLVTWHKGDNTNALKILNSVLYLASEASEGYEIFNTLWIISDIYSAEKKYSNSNEILFKLLKEYEAMNNERQISKVLTSLSRNLIELNEMDKALGYLNKSLEITTRLSTPFEMLENYRNLAHVEAILHNFKAADSLQDLFASTYLKLHNSDSLSNTKKVKEISDVPDNQSKLSLVNWIIAFFLFTNILVLSVFMYREKK